MRQGGTGNRGRILEATASHASDMKLGDEVMMNLFTLIIRDLQGLFDSLGFHIRTVHLLSEHLRIILDLLLCPINEALSHVNTLLRKYQRGSDLQLATSFSLKLAKNQSAVCLIPVNTTTARSLIYIPMSPSNLIARMCFRMTSVRAARNVLRAGGPALSRRRRAIRLTTVDLRLVGRAREPRRALVKEAVKGVNFAARGGVVESFVLPRRSTYIMFSFRIYGM